MIFIVTWKIWGRAGCFQVALRAAPASQAFSSGDGYFGKLVFGWVYRKVWWPRVSCILWWHNPGGPHTNLRVSYTFLLLPLGSLCQQRVVAVAWVHPGLPVWGWALRTDLPKTRCLAAGHTETPSTTQFPPLKVRGSPHLPTSQSFSVEFNKLRWQSMFHF